MKTCALLLGCIVAGVIIGLLADISLELHRLIQLVSQ